MRADLHFHSRYSDGTQWPGELARAAKAAGIECAALTDHDSLEGVPGFLEACRAGGLAGVAGAEVDCVAPEIAFSGEVLVYFPGGSFAGTRRFLQDRIAARRRAAGAFLAARFQGGASLEDFDRLRLGQGIGPSGGTGAKLPSAGSAGCQAVGPEGRAADPALLTTLKPQVLEYLKRSGLLDRGVSLAEFKAMPGFPGTKRPHPRDVAAAAAGDGGLMVVPHPGHALKGGWTRMTEDPAELRRVLAWFKEAGAWGVERYYYTEDAPANAAANAAVERAARELGLVLTCGSDHHGPAREDDGGSAGRDTLGLFAPDFAGFP